MKKILKEELEIVDDILSFPPPTHPPESFFKIIGGSYNFIAKTMADTIQETMKFVALGENSDIYVYRKTGVWVDNGLDVIKAIVTNWLGDMFKPTHATYTEKYIRYTNYIRKGLLGGNPKKVALENGVYDIETGAFDEHSPDFYMLQVLPFKYDPNAKCPEVNKFLVEVCEERVETLKEMIAYCLYRDMPIHRFFMLVGSGRNGKGTFIDLVKSFLGHENVASVSLQQIDANRFRAAELFGKMACLNNDIPSKALRTTGILKQLTSGDLITVEKKRQDPFQFENYAKLIFSANQVPRSTDMSDAFYRRAITIMFEQIFEDGENADPNKLDTITTDEELSGLFNECIPTLKTLFERGKFYGEKTIPERKMEYIKLSDPVQYFAVTQVVKDVKTYVIKADLYDAYVVLCESLDKIPTSDNWFAKNVRRYLPYTHEAMITIANKKVRIWKGIKIIDSGDTQYTQYTQFPLYNKSVPQNNIKRENAVYCVSTVSDDERKSLQEQLQETLEELSKIQKAIGDDPVDIQEFVKLMMEKGYKASEVKRFIEVLKIDGLIYEPRPGFLKVCPT